MSSIGQFENYNQQASETNLLERNKHKPPLLKPPVKELPELESVGGKSYGCIILVLVVFFLFFWLFVYRGSDYLFFSKFEHVVSKVNQKKGLRVYFKYHLETASKGDCYFDFYLNKVPVDGKCYNGFAKSFPRGDGITKVEACFYKSFEADEMYVTMIRSDDWSALKKHFFDIPRRILQISIPINIKYDALSDTLTVSKPQ